MRDQVKSLLTTFLELERDSQIRWLVAGAFLFLALSAPLNLLHGFLFAEEGTTYLRYARVAQPVRALLAPHQQYFSLLPNLLGVVEARLLPLSAAAIVAAWTVLLVHLCLMYIVAQCERFTGGLTRLLAVALALLAAGAAAVSVGSTQTQFAFALMCVLVLISDVTRLPILRTLCTLMGGLNGLVSCMLLPFFLYRAWRTGQRTAWVQAVLLSLCCVLQGAVLLHALPFAMRGADAHTSPVAMMNVIANHMLVLPFLSRLAYYALSLLGTVPLVFWSLAVAAICGFLFLGAVIWPAGTWARLLFVIGVSHACCCVLGMGGEYREILRGGERYFYVANTSFALALLLRWQQVGAPRRLSLVSGLLLLVLLSGGLDSLRFWRLNQSGAVWGDEVHAWTLDPAHVTLTANPVNWSPHRMYLPVKPLRIDLPFYIFDSNTRPEALQGFSVALGENTAALR